MLRKLPGRASSGSDKVHREGSRGFGKPVEILRIVDEDALARRLFRRPYGEEIEQQGVVREGSVLLARMGPVAAPHQSLRRRLDEGLRGPGGFRIAGRADLA